MSSSHSSDTSARASALTSAAKTPSGGGAASGAVSAAASPVGVADFGDFAALMEAPAGGIPGKRFASSAVGLTSSEISLNRMPAGKGYGFTHRHKRNEEVYVIVAGRGVLYADERQIPLSPGTVVRLAPAVLRTMRASEEGPLDYLCFQAPEGGMPYSFMEDGVPVSTEVPYGNVLPLPEPLRAYFAPKGQA